MARRTRKYEYRGKRHYGIPADVAAAELERIRKQYGTLQVPVVVDEARPEDAPLHPVFTWDDVEAGEKWRRWRRGR